MEEGRMRLLGETGASPAAPDRSLRLPALFVIWITGALAGLLWLAFQARRARLLVRRSRPAAPEDCPLDLTALALECGLRRAPRVRVTGALASPAVTGLISPVLLLPEGLAAALTPGQLRWAAAHELSHLRRGDLWVQLFESVMKCLFFFHPAVWVASRQLTERREECCDHAASALTGLPARESAAGLLTLLQRALPVSAPLPGAALGMGISMSGGHRMARRRMRRLLAGAPPDRHALFPWTAAAIMPAAAVLSLGAVRPSHGGGSPEARRILELESRVAELEGRLSTKTRRETLRENAEAAARARANRDTERYSPEELHAMELIYQEAKKRPDFDSMIPAMQPLFDRFPASNRAGCAALYLGRRLEGEERARLLTWAADSAGDCLFLDGTTVGGLARILLARDALTAGRPDEAAARLREARASHADGIDFEGNSIADLADALARELP
ncbi:MAG: M56 family metallopeptidase [Verrucomicrobiaceae bacterium]|nr:MAG: M56 family metallopeptidase [Verrucomicrobiaceae bacterium]